MSKTEPPPTPPVRKKRRWLRWTGIFLLALLLLHNPILHGILGVVARKAATSAGIQLQFESSGWLFHELEIRNLQATGNADSPVQSAVLKRAVVRYNFLKLAMRGIPRFVTSLTVRDLDLKLSAAKPTPSSPKTEPFRMPRLAIPIPKRTELQGINIRVGDGPDAVQLSGFDFLLDYKKQGKLSIARLEIPGLNPLSGIRAETEQGRGDFTLQNIELLPDWVVQELRLQTNNLEQGQVGLTMKASILGATVNVATAIIPGEKSESLWVGGRVEGIDLERLQSVAPALAGTSGRMDVLDFAWYGDPNDPKSWTGFLTGIGGGIVNGPARIDTVELRSWIGGGKYHLQNLAATSGTARTDWNGVVDLPAKFTTQSANASLDFTASARDLSEFQAIAGVPVTGGLFLNGRATIRRGWLRVNATSNASFPAVGETRVEGIYLTAKVSQRLRQLEDIRNLQAELSLVAWNALSGNIAVDTARMEANASKGVVTVSNAEVVRGTNTLRLNAIATLPAASETLSKTAVTGGWNIEAPTLAELTLDPAAMPVGGSVTGNGTFLWHDQKHELRGDITGSNLAWGTARVQSIQTGFQTSDDNTVTWNSHIIIDDKNFGSIEATTQIAEPRPFTLKARFEFPNLKGLEPVLQIAGVTKKTEGSLSGSLSLEGELGNVANAVATWDLKLAKTTFDTVTGLDADFTGTLDHGVLTVPKFRVTNLGHTLSATVSTNGNKLQIDTLLIQRGNTPLLSGIIYLPLTRTPDSLPSLDTTGPVFAQIRSEKLSIQEFLAAFKQQSPVAGIVALNADLSGTLDNPVLSIQSSGTQIRGVSGDPFQPASYDLLLKLAGTAANLEGTIRQPEVSPISITGSMPISMCDVMNGKALSPDAPVTARLVLPKSSLSFLTRQFPAIRFLDASSSMNVAVGGTLSKPEFSGDIDLDIKTLRMANPNIPLIGDFSGRMVFEKQSLRFERFAGQIAGGPFSFSGDIKLIPPALPQLDVRIKIEKVLVLRNDLINLRTNGDIAITGPIDSAKVAGTIGITSSRISKEIEILPIALPGRPAPKPPQVQRRFSIDVPALAKWTFDVRIKTDDPILIRSNLARGKAVVDLKLGGTGITPTLDGNVSLDGFDATLPFSRLSVSRGNLFFSASADPLDPIVDLQGFSTIRDYEISTYVFGRINSLETMFVSQPPLAQEDIISLIATGATIDELSSNSGIIAGRATLLLFQRLYQEFAKKKMEPADSKFLNRLDLTVGGLDPRTGHEAISARYQITDRFYLVGDADVAGDLRGQIKYLIRFR